MTVSKAKWVWSLFAVLPLLLSAPATFAESRTKVGVIVPLTGAFAQYGVKIKNAVESAAATLPIELVFEDEGCDPAVALRSYRRLTDIEGIKLFLGPWCGSPQRVTAPLVATHKQLALLSSAAPESVYESSRGRMLSVQHSIEKESRENARFVFERGHKRVVILFAENDFSRAHEAAFREAFSGDVIETLTYAPGATTEIRALVTKIRALGVDALYVPDAFPILGNLMRELQTAGLRKLPVYSVNSIQSKEVLDVIGPAGEGISYSYPDVSAPDAVAYFADRAVQILGKAIGSCPTGDIACVKATLRSQNSFDTVGTLPSGIIHKTIRDGRFVVE